MLKLVLGLPGQLRDTLPKARKVDIGPKRRPDAVVVAGMGGSAIGGDIVRCLMQERSSVPVMVCRDYKLPAAAGKNSLLLAVSYSGNTEETLAAFRQGIRRGCRTVVVTSGGQLGRLAVRHDLPIFPVPGGLPPRASVGYLTVPQLVVMERLGLLPGASAGVREASRLLRARAGVWLRAATGIARRLNGNLPVVYSTCRLLDVVADRWRCQLNENSKVLCHSHVFPEHNHNEIVGLGGPVGVARRSVLVVLEDRSTHPRTARRVGFALDIARSAFREALRIGTTGRSGFARLISLVMLGDLVSVELARLRGVDPMPVARIDELKRRMSRVK